MPGSGDYFYLGGQGEAGPLDAPALRDLRRRGKITDTTLVRQGNGPWITYAEHPELLAPAAEETGERRYPTTLGIRWLTTIVVVPSVAVLGWVGLFPWRVAALEMGGWAFLWAALFWVLAILLVVLAWGAWTGYILLSPDRIEQRSPFEIVALSRKEIAGYRIGRVKNSRFLLLIPKDPRRKKLKVDTTVTRYLEIWRWAAENFPDLAAVEAAAATERLLAIPGKSGTREERLEQLARASRTASRVHGLVLGLSLLCLLPFMPGWSAAILIALPLLPLAFLWIFRDYAVLDSAAGDPRDKIIISAFYPLPALAVRGVLDVHLLAPWWQLVLPAVLFGVAGMIILGVCARQKSLALLVFFPFLAMYGSGLFLESDAWLDSGSYRAYPVTVLTTSVSSGKGPHYHVIISGWPHHLEIETFDVSRPFYQAIHPGDQIVVVVHPGFWNVPWGFLHRPTAPPHPTPISI